MLDNDDLTRMSFQQVLSELRRWRRATYDYFKATDNDQWWQARSQLGMLLVGCVEGESVALTPLQSDLGAYLEEHGCYKDEAPPRRGISTEPSLKEELAKFKHIASEWERIARECQEANVALIEEQKALHDALNIKTTVIEDYRNRWHDADDANAKLKEKLDFAESKWRGWHEAERRLSAAYIRLRELIPGCMDISSESDDSDAFWAAVEDKVRLFVGDRNV